MLTIKILIHFKKKTISSNTIYNSFRLKKTLSFDQKKKFVSLNKNYSNLAHFISSSSSNRIFFLSSK